MEALRRALTATMDIIRMRVRRMVFTVPAISTAASLSEPVRGSAADLEAVDSDVVLMADGALTVDSEAADLTVADAASVVADSAVIRAADSTAADMAQVAASTVVVADSTAEAAGTAAAVMVVVDTGKL